MSTVEWLTAICKLDKVPFEVDNGEEKTSSRMPASRLIRGASDAAVI